MKRLNHRLALLVACLALLGATLAACAPAGPPPPTPPPPTPTPIPKAVRLEVVGGKQSKNLTCESQSASDLAKFWGKPVAEMEFFNKLPRSDNPHKGFVGTPDSPPGGLPPNGYGVYAGPVAETLRQFGLDAEAHTNKGVNWLRQELAAGRPVIVWATYSFKEQPVKTYTPRDGQAVPVVPYEHTFLAVGYDDAGVYVIDPLAPATTLVSYADFTRGWNLLGQMAVTARLPAAAAPAPDPSSSAPVSERPPWWVPLLALLMLAAGLLGLRGNVPRRRATRLAHSVAVPMTRTRPARTAWRSALPATAAVRARLAPLERRTRRWATWPMARPLPLALLGIAASLVALFVIGAVSPCFTLPVLAVGGGLGFWLGLWAQATQRASGG